MTAWLKSGSATWTQLKSMFVKTTSSVWTEVRSAWVKTSSSGWTRVFFRANLPIQSVAPTIRTTNNTGTGGTYDGPVATSPKFLNTDLFGKDGTYSNYTSIFGRKFTYADTLDATSRSLAISGDLFTSGGGVTTAIRQSVEEKYLFYELTVQNGSSANEIYPISSPVFMIKSQPYSNSFTTTGALEVGNFVTANIDIEYYYYNRPELSSSYVKWYVGNYLGDTSGTPVQTTSLTSALDSTSSTQYLGSDLLYIDSSYSGKYVTAILVVESSWTRYYGYSTSTYQLDYDYAGGGGTVSSPLSFSNIVVKDYNNNSGLDNRANWPTGTINKYTATLTGYTSGTTIRIRYRVFNSNNSTYYKPSTAAASTASASWDSWNSDGSGNGYISDVSISGGTATISDNLYLDETVFNGGGAYPGNFQLHVELSALKPGGTRVYYLSPYDTYYISKRIDSSVSVSPTTVAPSTNVTISGSFAGFPATPSTNAYPKQYKVTYGDGNNSGWLPVPEYSFGTVNPSFSLTKSYSSAGTYTITLDTIPFGSSATTSVTVASLKTAPTITSIVAGNTGGNVSVYFSGGSGPYYQIYWSVSSTAPTSPVTPDGSGSSSPVSDTTGPSSTSTYYMYIRSVQTAGETSVGPSTVASAWSAGVAFNMTLSKLATPANVNATDTRTDGVNVTWDIVSGASYYGVWYGGAPSYDSLADFGGNRNTSLIVHPTNSYLDTAIGSGVTRDYYVQAYRSGDPTGTKSEWGGPNSGTRLAVVNPPSGGSVFLSGNNTPGSVITASTSGWSNSPTSYDVFITTTTSGTPTSSSTRVASSNGSSSTSYTITSTDAAAPANIFRAFATASNTGGTSGTVQSSNTITASAGSPATAPGTPGTPTNGWTSGTSYPFSWSAPSAGTVTGGGAATITGYTMRIYEATSSAGAGSYIRTTISLGSGTSYTYTSPNASLYYAASVAATNSAGLTGSYSGISLYK